MAREWNDRWLLVRLAAQNLGKCRLRAFFLGMAVMLGCGVGFASFVCGWSIGAAMTTSLSRMGADLVVVPRAALVNITSSLLTVQPTDETLPRGLSQSLAAIPGIDRVAPQRIVRMPVNGSEANLIAFDPVADFSILPWLGEHLPGPLDDTGLIAGPRASGRVGEVLNICGKSFKVYGRLGQTGVGPFDESYFSSFGALGGFRATCPLSPLRNLDPATGPETRVGGTDERASVAGVNASDAMPATSETDVVSAFMVRLSSDARVEDVKFALARLPNLRIVEGNNVLTSSRQALSSLMIGIAISNVLQLTALLITISLLFSAIVQERYREVGLLRAMGAKPRQIMTVMLAEAAMITGLGGVAGLGLGVVLLLIFARSLGFYFGLIGIPFAWPPLVVLGATAGIAVLLSAVIGLVGAFLPSWRVCRTDPHILIQGEIR